MNFRVIQLLFSVVMIAKLSLLSSSQYQPCFSSHEGSSVSVACSSGFIITAINFASYGTTPYGSCGAYATAICHAPSSNSVVSSKCLNQPSCSIDANNNVFGDPCDKQFKGLYVQVTCSELKPSIEPIKEAITESTIILPWSLINILPRPSIRIYSSLLLLLFITSILFWNGLMQAERDRQKKERITKEEKDDNIDVQAPSQTKPLSELSVNDVIHILESLNLRNYCAVFRENDIDGPTLMNCHSIKDVEELGIAIVAKARILYEEILKFKLTGVPLTIICEVSHYRYFFSSLKCFI